MPASSCGSGGSVSPFIWTFSSAGRAVAPLVARVFVVVLPIATATRSRTPFEIPPE